MKLYLAIGILMVSFWGASADIATITVTGNARSTTMGYTLGESYSFSFTVSDLYTGGSEDNFFRNYGPGGWTGDNLWKAGLSSDPALLASLAGDHILGTYARPGTTAEATFEYIWADQDEETLAFRFQNDDQWNSTLGLTVDGKAVELFDAHYLDVPGLDASDGLFLNPVTWLSDYAGTYNYSGTGFLDPQITIRTTLGGSTVFSATSLTIEAVPEPATAMMLFFGGGIGFSIHRLRRWANR